MAEIQSEKTALSGSPSPSWPRSPREVEMLVEAYAGPLLRYAFRRLGSYQDAEDVVQQVFVRALVNPSKPSSVSAVVPYLYRSVANCCVDVLRTRNAAAAMH